MLNFPSNPTEDQQVTLNGKSYIYKAGRWLSLATFMLINGDLEKRLKALEASETRLVAVEASVSREKDKRIGCFFFHGGPSAPKDSLIANGSAISRAAYADLFAKIGTVYGGGNGSTTFNLPDLRGVVPRGLDLDRGFDSGRTLGSYQADDNKVHNHATSGVDHSHSFSGSTSSDNHSHTITTIGNYVNTFGGGSPSSQGSTTQSTSNYTHAHSVSGNTSGHYHTHGISYSGEIETRVKNVALLPCIWYA